ncbi:hypothetical protein DL98DRAFT_606916 [Cadophora sp. DSE1049]|nr:hypothetical protein DL98DRAFT_606916 [Cadophora sp. DSE1049]
MSTSSEHSESPNLGSPDGSKDRIVEYENYNYRFRDIQEIFPHRESWKTAYNDASCMDREVPGRQSTNSSYLLERLESIEGGLAVMFDLLAGLRSREWTLARIQHEQALMYFGEYLAVIYTYFRSLPTWRDSPLLKMTCTTIEKNSWRPYVRELLRRFSEQENIPLQTVSESIRLYSERCRLAHPDNMIRGFTKNHLWSELERQFDADNQSLTSRKLMRTHDRDFKKSLQMFKELHFADVPTAESHAEGGQQTSACVLSLRARTEIRAEMEAREAMDREQQKLDRKRENCERGLSVQSLGQQEKTLIHDDISEFWDAFENDQQ